MYVYLAYMEPLRSQSLQPSPGEVVASTRYRGLQFCSFYLGQGESPPRGKRGDERYLVTSTRTGIIWRATNTITTTAVVSMFPQKVSAVTYQDTPFPSPSQRAFLRKAEASKAPRPRNT